MKFSLMTDVDYTGANVSYGVGVGYQLGKVPTYKVRKKDRVKEEEIKLLEKQK